MAPISYESKKANSDSSKSLSTSAEDFGMLYGYQDKDDKYQWCPQINLKPYELFSITKEEFCSHMPMLLSYLETFISFPYKYSRENVLQLFYTYDTPVTLNKFIKQLWDIIVDMVTLKLYWKNAKFHFEFFGPKKKMSGMHHLYMNILRKEPYLLAKQNLWSTYFYFLLRLHFGDDNVLETMSPEIKTLKGLFTTKKRLREILIESNYKALLIKYGNDGMYFQETLAMINYVLEYGNIDITKKLHYYFEIFLSSLFKITDFHPICNVRFRGSCLVLNKNDSLKVRIELVTFVFVTIRLESVIIGNK